MELHFLGGATTVTGSQFLLVTKQARILIDCGMFQGGPNEAVRNRIPFAFDPARLDAVVLSHAHLDHCGMLPVLVREGFTGPIHTTHGTVELASLVLLDSGRLQEEFAKRDARWERRHPEKAVEEDREDQERFAAAVELASAAVEAVDDDIDQLPPAVDMEAELRQHPAELRIDLDEPLYTEDHARATLPLFLAHRYGETFGVASGVQATLVDAGHILGSAIIQVVVSGGPDGQERRIVFSGDLGRPGTPIIRDPTILTDADYVVVESTYGGREHEPQQEAIKALADTVRLVAEHDGVLLVPSFAIGRTQEIVWTLDRLIEAGEIPTLPLFLDSPMASKATEIYRRHAEAFDDQTRRLLQEGATPLDYPDQTVTNSAAQSRAIAKAKRPYMIVASNGMLTGGRVVAHLRELVDDPAATLLFVGYQGEGTLGWHLQNGATTIRLDGQTREVRCRVRSISGFSAHADESELLDWVGHFVEGRKAGEPGVPRRVFLVHGDPDAQVALAPKVRALGLEPYVPHWREAVTLD
jgi:metallo-beta-lactamase family protein